MVDTLTLLPVDLILKKLKFIKSIPKATEHDKPYISLSCSAEKLSQFDTVKRTKIKY